MKQAREFPVFTVTPKAARSLAAGHPWVYAEEVLDAQPCENGALADVFSQKGSWLGTGLVSLQSKIRVRVLSRNANDVFDESFWRRRLRYAWEYRKAVMGPDVSNCRIIFGEADQFPGLTVDRYGTLLSAQVLSVGMEPRIAELAGKLNHENVTETPCIIHCEKKNEGFKTASKVQYVARTGNFIDRGVEYTGALQILKVILSYDYLWQNIRVKGGAYGCMSSFNRIGEGYFVSYRDPNLKRTIDVYEGVVDYLENFTVSDRDMTKYIIGTISNIDQPMTPATKGERSMNLYMNKVSAEMIKKERAQILDAAQEDIRALAKVAKAVLAADQLCVIGGEEKIEEDKELFGVVTSF